MFKEYRTAELLFVMVEILETHRFKKNSNQIEDGVSFSSPVTTSVSLIICISSSQNQDNRQCNYHSNAHDTLKALKVNRNK